MIDTARRDALLNRINEHKEIAGRLRSGFVGADAWLNQHASRIWRDLDEINLLVDNIDDNATPVGEAYWLDYAEFNLGLHVQSLERMLRVTRDLYCV